ncbi:axin isoform X2 [Aphidius gifuensis]|uniref:axin isoform X2 n=1 Tax=Aphidius gifuensis TaxID=684658 RepID=UPI001CDC1F44|nr:axin isoform X2 [Aphidius gifuensis]
MSGTRRKEGSYFNENSPRPPVPEEATTSRFRPESPAPLTPRRSSVINKNNDKKFNPSISSNINNKLSPPMGFEPEGRCEEITMEKNSPKHTCLEWATDLCTLLKDEIGLNLFRKYLKQEEISDKPLIFWFSCEGLKDNNDDYKIQQLVKIINKRFIRRGHLPISAELKTEIQRKIDANKFDKHIYDEIQKKVEKHIENTVYENFKRSDIYLNLIHETRNNNFFPDEKNLSTSDMSLSCGANSLLPTLHEDSEFIGGHMTQSACNTPGEFKLTQDILMKTQKTRAANLLPKPEAFAGMSPYHMSSSRPDAQYSYNPVSRQDSELQSLSSDARTESDNLSINSSVDGISLGRRNNRTQAIRFNRQMKESLKLNHNVESNIAIIPRTAYVTKNSKKSLSHDEFAEVICSKLEKVLKEREENDKIERCIKNPTTDDDDNSKIDGFTDDNDHILDDHLSRVWPKSRSPGIDTPCGDNLQDIKNSLATVRSLKSRKDKDVFSTLSIDSGNIPDLNEIANAAGSVHSYSSTIPKSKSVPSEYAESLSKLEPYQSGNHNIAAKHSITKKSTTELTDSGVSVVSDTRPAIPAKGYRASTWSAQQDIKPDSKNTRQQKYDWSRPAQPIATVPGMPLLPVPNTSIQLEEARRRLEENTRSWNDCSSSISSVNSINRHYQVPTKQQQQHHHQQQQHDAVSLHSVSHLSSVSNPSTLRRSHQSNDNYTRVYIMVSDDKVPYLIKIPGHNITLRQFKEHLPQKGNHRYFFKTKIEDPDIEIFWEEITDDLEILPLWNGTIRAQVKPVD